MNTTLGDLELSIRRFAYDEAMNRAAIPSRSELARALHTTEREVGVGLSHLADAHMLALQRDSGEILMLNPFSAVPTPFAVRIGDRSWYGNCIWDAMGIASMLHSDAVIDASCGCCGSKIVLSVPRDCRDHDQRLVHFAIPAARWWADIVFS